jgi:hypothetical protein
MTTGPVAVEPTLGPPGRTTSTICNCAGQYAGPATGREQRSVADPIFDAVACDRYATGCTPHSADRTRLA